jgi:2Fe-2S ferredoxin
LLLVFFSLIDALEVVDVLLVLVWGLVADSSLACLGVVGDEVLVVELPKYTINHAKENH